MTHNKPPCSTIILAAGKGKRMRSELPKVLHLFKGKTMIDAVLDTTEELNSKPNIVIVGHKKDDVMQHLSKRKNILFAVQEEQKGTAHAVEQAEPFQNKLADTVCVLMGDVPLLKAETISHLLAHHHEKNAVVSILSACFENPFGYGRIVCNNKGDVLKIVEEKDCTDKERKIKKINSGIYCFQTSFLFDKIKTIENENKQAEFYLTDMVEIAVKEGKTVSEYTVANNIEVAGVNSAEDLRTLEEKN